MKHAQSDPPTESDLKRYLFDLLARRDYSKAQLRDKLSRRTNDLELINRLLDQFERNGYQSDERFAESHVRQRLAQGYGVRRIQQELRYKGVDAEQIQALMQESPSDPKQLALEYVRKKYGERVCVDEKEKLKRVRHLAGRGFGFDEIQFALRHQLERDWE